MPEISRFYGIIIRMFHDEHAPPHFHAIYQNDEAQFNIKTLEIIEGSLPRSAQRLVKEWALIHQNELLQNWERAQKPEPLDKIAPLD